MYRSGVPQVMQSRLITAAVVPQHAGPNAQPAKDIFRGIPLQRASIAGQEQCRVRFGGVFLGTLGYVGLQSNAEIRAQGHQLRLVEFAFADRENAGGQIDIG